MPAARRGMLSWEDYMTVQSHQVSRAIRRRISIGVGAEQGIFLFTVILNCLHAVWPEGLKNRIGAGGL